MDTQLATRAASVADLLRRRADTVAVSESASGGLVSASLLSVPGASAYFVGGTVVYTIDASRALLRGVVDTPEGLRGATEEFALWQAESVRGRLGATWGLGETGAAGPTGNRYGDPAGHSWAGVAGPVSATRNTRTGDDDRSANMHAFACAVLDLFIETLSSAPT
jgi:PncC family amidohydrolase